MKPLRYIFLSLALFSVSLSFAAADCGIAETLRAGLSHVSAPGDSLKILLDVFDATDQAGKRATAEEILALARRTGDQATLLEFIPRITVLNMRNDEKMRSLLEVADEITDPTQRKGIKVFININRAVNEATYLPEDERHKALMKYVQDDMRYSDDIFQNFLDLSRVVVFLGQSSQNTMYMEYLDRLFEMLDQLPGDCYYIRNLFYTTAANTYTANGNHEKAVEADRKLLEIIKQLEYRYKKQGRKYRNYDRYYYLSYRRMLRNYPALSLKEVEDIYAKCEQLAQRNVELRRDFYDKEAVTAYRLMAREDYQAAVPKLKKALTRTDNRNVRHILLKMIVEASDSIDDNATLLTALKDYNVELEKLMHRRNEESYRELAMRKDIDVLKNEKSRLELEKKDVEVMTGQKIITLILVALLVLAIVVMLLYKRHYVLRQHMRDLRIRNHALSEQLQQMINHGTPSGSVPLHKHSDS